MKIYRDSDGNKVVEVNDLSFLSDRDHPYNWFQRHFHHFALKVALIWADKVVASDRTVASDLVRYYFVPKESIVLKDS
ncbi:MAG: hypothetical protein IJN02_00685 [Bacteroidales bacterium]|nr:hypothetical protein [Bacteroidales bacterium]